MNDSIIFVYKLLHNGICAILFHFLLEEVNLAICQKLEVEVAALAHFDMAGFQGLH